MTKENALWETILSPEKLSEAIEWHKNNWHKPKSDDGIKKKKS